MKTTIQARLDSQSSRILNTLLRRGWTQSRAIREGLQLLASVAAGDGETRIIGLGKFDSGIADLGSDKKHLGGFGK
ncbi:MAG: hypothetical protein HYZ57_06005 [Acidobacteria bacterium]|nr:hypothetical protein [Acidobacteriota bacterium]MBI3279380.1 hypothetical protein [Acidobacteriota bacterium]